MCFPTLTDGMHILEQIHAGFASDDGESRTKQVLGCFELLQDHRCIMWHAHIHISNLLVTSYLFSRNDNVILKFSILVIPWLLYLVLQRTAAPGLQPCQRIGHVMRISGCAVLINFHIAGIRKFAKFDLRERKAFPTWICGTCVPASNDDL